MHRLLTARLLYVGFLSDETHMGPNRDTINVESLTVWFLPSFDMICCCSVTHSCPTLCDPMDCSMPGLPVPHHLWNLPKFMSIEFMMPSSHLILWSPLLHLSSIFPSIRDFSNESAIHIRWPKYWSFIFSIRSSNKYSGLISFKINLFYLLVVQGTLRGLLLDMIYHSVNCTSKYKSCLVF